MKGGKMGYWNKNIQEKYKNRDTYVYFSDNKNKDLHRELARIKTKYELLIQKAPPSARPYLFIQMLVAMIERENMYEEQDGS